MFFLLLSSVFEPGNRMVTVNAQNFEETEDFDVFMRGG